MKAIAPTSYVEQRTLELIEQAKQKGYVEVSPGFYLCDAQDGEEVEKGADKHGNPTYATYRGLYTHTSDGQMSGDELRFVDLIDILAPALIAEYNEEVA